MNVYEKLLENDTAGDPITGLRWTRKTKEKIAVELGKVKIEVCANTVGRLLKKQKISLKVNNKYNERSVNVDPKDRDKQFKYIEKQRNLFYNKGCAAVSADGKKKELIGNFKNNGSVYCREAEKVNVYDFPSDAEGKALPYGLYEIFLNKGVVSIGTSYDTPSFAVDTVEYWWKNIGRYDYQNKQSFLIVADGGGSNSSRSRVWKFELSEKICKRYGVEITVCHYPPGCSKWNPIEHRLFSFISKNWAGVPFRSHEIMINYIKTTRTSKGLTVDSHLVKKQYEKGKKVSKEQWKALNIRYHETFQNWNYTLRP